MIEDEADPMIEQRSPRRHAHGALSHAVQAIIGGPAVEEKAFVGLAFAEGPQKARRQRPFAAQMADGHQLVANIARVLLAFAACAVVDQILGAIVEGVDGGREQAVEGGFAAA